MCDEAVRRDALRTISFGLVAEQLLDAFGGARLVGEAIRLAEGASSAAGEGRVAPQSDLDEALDSQSLVFLRRHMRGVNVETEFRHFKAWCGTAEPAALAAHLWPSRDRRKGVDAPVEVKRILRVAQRNHDPNLPNPVHQRLVLEWTIGMLSHVLGQCRSRLCILVDSNVLLHLLADYGALSRMAKSTRDCLDPDARLYVTASTLQELRNVAARSGDAIIRLYLRAIEGDLPTVDDAANLDPWALEYLSPDRRNAGPSFAEMVDGKIMEIIACGDDPRRRVSLLDTNCEVPVGEAAQLTERIHTDLPLLKREWGKDLHDVTLLTFAAKRNLAQTDERWVVWTHHVDLPVFARALDLPGATVAFGPAAALWQSRPSALPVSQLRAAFRALLARDQRSLPNHLPLILQRLVAEINRNAGGDERQWDPFSWLACAAHGSKEWSPEASDWAPVDAVPLDATPQGTTLSMAPESHILRGPVVPQSFLRSSGASRWVSASAKLGQACGGHGVPSPRILRERVLPHWEIGVHAATHTDLLWAAEAEPQPGAISAAAGLRASSAKAAALRRDFLRPRAIGTTMIDLRDRQDAAEKQLGSAGVTPLPTVPAARIADALRGVAIDERDLRDRLKGRSVAGNMVILHTGWTRYQPAGHDLSGAENGLRWLWLMHPWLTEGAVAYLVGQRVSGIAIDCPMADCPLPITAAASSDRRAFEAEELLRQPRSRAQDEHASPCDNVVMPHEQTCHLAAFRHGIALLENLRIAEEPCAQWYGSERIVQTTAFVTFLHHSLMMDGALCSLLLEWPTGKEMARA